MTVMASVLEAVPGSGYSKPVTGQNTKAIIKLMVMQQNSQLQTHNGKANLATINWQQLQ